MLSCPTVGNGNHGPRVCVVALTNAQTCTIYHVRASLTTRKRGRERRRQAVAVSRTESEALPNCGPASMQLAQPFIGLAPPPTMLVWRQYTTLPGQAHNTRALLCTYFSGGTNSWHETVFYTVCASMRKIFPFGN